MQTMHIPYMRKDELMSLKKDIKSIKRIVGVERTSMENLEKENSSFLPLHSRDAVLLEVYAPDVDGVPKKIGAKLGENESVYAFSVTPKYNQNDGRYIVSLADVWVSGVNIKGMDRIGSEI